MGSVKENAGCFIAILSSVVAALYDNKSEPFQLYYPYGTTCILRFVQLWFREIFSQVC